MKADDLLHELVMHGQFVMERGEVYKLALLDTGDKAQADTFAFASWVRLAGEDQREKAMTADEVIAWIREQEVHNA